MNRVRMWLQRPRCLGTTPALPLRSHVASARCLVSLHSLPAVRCCDDQMRTPRAARAHLPAHGHSTNRWAPPLPPSLPNEATTVIAHTFYLCHQPATQFTPSPVLVSHLEEGLIREGHQEEKWAGSVPQPPGGGRNTTSHLFYLHSSPVTLGQLSLTPQC